MGRLQSVRASNCTCLAVLSLALLPAGCGPRDEGVAARPATPRRTLTSRPIRAVRLPELPPPEELPDFLRADDWFEDVTEHCGIRFSHRNGREGGRFYLIENFGAGVAVFDYDLDDEPDILLTGGGSISSGHETPVISGLRPALFRNAGGWRFEEVGPRAGLERPIDYTLGCTVVDFNVDGWPDLFLYCYGRCQLFANLGDGTFADAVGAEGLPSPGMTTTAVWADLDRDALPDLVVARYVDWTPAIDVACHSESTHRRVLCGPGHYEPTTAVCFRNRGDGGFEDWSQTVGLKPYVKGLGLIAGDFNADGLVDVYLANDELANHLYWGQPRPGMLEDAIKAGAALDEFGTPEGSMGVDAGDVDGDGLPEIWVVNYKNQDNSLYRNLGGGRFRHSTLNFGLGGVSRMRVGWGTSLTDFDGDGWLDVLVINGGNDYFAADWAQLAQLFQNQGGARFRDVSASGGTFFRRPYPGRGSAQADLDGDGAPDLVAAGLNEPARILRNRRPPPNWVDVRLRGTRGAPDATGARIVSSLQGRRLVRWVWTGAGYASYSEPRFVLPVEPGDRTARVTIDWPGRGTEVFSNLSVMRRHLLIEGQGQSDE